MTNLEKFITDLREERIGQASLFWLRVFALHAQNDSLRSDEWIEIGLREGTAIAGLDITDPAPRLALLTDYDLFQAERLKDNQVFSGNELASLDWNRKYKLSLRVGLENGVVSEWVEKLWQEVGPVPPQDQALEKLLAERSPLWGHNVPDPSLLLEILHEAQAIYGGWLPRPALTRIAHALNLPLSEVYGVTEFYTMFYTEPVGKKIIRICEDAPCAIRGSEQVQAALCSHLQIEPGETTADGEYTLEPVRCLGVDTLAREVPTL